MKIVLFRSASAQRFLRGRLFSCLLGALVISSFGIRTVRAQDWAKADLAKSPRHQEWIKVEHDGRTVETFVVYPESKTKTPVVVIIHEIFGLSDWVQSLADQVAEAGYIAVAPDLLSGMGPGAGRTSSFAGQSAITEAVSHLDPAQVTADLQAVSSQALKLPAANGKLFVAGFCWGGGQTFRFATNRKDIAGAFVFYGPPPFKPSTTEMDAAAIGRIETKVYGFYGGNDARVNASIPAATEAMKAAGKKYEPVIYDGAGHGFMRAGQAPDANESNKKARAEALERLKLAMKSSL